MAEKRKSSAEAAEDLFDDLFSSTAAVEENTLPRDRDAVLIDRNLIETNDNNPRHYFPEAGLISLGESMREVGQQQNIVVRPHPKRRGRYQLVAGERRWRAAAPAYGDIPMLRAVVRKLSDYEVARIIIDENDRREDVSPIARARGLQHLYDVSPGTRDGTADATKRPTWEQVAQSVGLTRRSAMRLVDLLDLPAPVQDKIERLSLSEKHGRALLSLREDAQAQDDLLQAIEAEEMSGNEALRRADKVRKEARPATEAPGAVTPHTEPQEEEGQGTGVSRETQLAPIQELQRGSGFDQGSTPQPKRYDPIEAHVRPALVQLTEAARRVEDTPQAPEYRRDLLQVLERVESEVERLRQGLQI